MTSHPPLRVLVLAAPASRGRALHRLSGLTARAWREAGAEVREIDGRDGFTQRLMTVTPRLGSGDHSWLSRQLRRDEPVDVVHVMDPLATPSALRLPGSPRLIVTIDDPAVVLGPGAQEQARRGAGRPVVHGRHQSVLKAVASADILLATTQYAADLVAAVLDRPVRVARPPVDPALGTRSPRIEGFTPPAWPYLLLVADSHPTHRRLSGIETWTHLRRTPHLDGLSLVVVGPELTAAEEAMVTACGGHVSVFSDIGDLQLGALYSRARAVLSLGIPQGFPWTVVEAHQAGRPVLATDHELFCEVGGSGCVYLPVEGIAHFDEHTWTSVAEDLTSAVVTERAADNAEAYPSTDYRVQLRQAAVGPTSDIPEPRALETVDLTRLDALLESSPWSAPPMTLAELSVSREPAPWDLPDGWEADLATVDSAGEHVGDHAPSASWWALPSEGASRGRQDGSNLRLGRRSPRAASRRALDAGFEDIPPLLGLVAEPGYASNATPPDLLEPHLVTLDADIGIPMARRSEDQSHAASGAATPPSRRTPRLPRGVPMAPRVSAQGQAPIDELDLRTVTAPEARAHTSAEGDWSDGA